MTILDTAGAAMLLAHAGRQQLAAALAIQAAHVRRAALAWLRGIPSLARRK